MIRTLFRAGSALLLLTGPAAAELEWTGFVEAAAGVRLGDVGNPPSEWGELPEGTEPPAVWSESGEFLLRETRLQLKTDAYADAGEAHVVLDLLADGLEDGDDVLEIREAWAKFDAASRHLEVRVGRQPTTWGTGDLLFINDLFPKDWVSFFAGREDQYLKVPSDAVRLGVFGLPFEVDVVWSPQFAPDRLPTGERLAFWTPAFAPTRLPADELGNGELAVRLSRPVAGRRLALYGYHGRWKSPLGLRTDPVSGEPTAFEHPRLSVGGASLRGALLGGVAWAEAGYYHSRDDTDGTNAAIPNSELRALAGFEREWWTDFTGGVQFYWEGMQDHAAARTSLTAAFGPDATLKDENRTLWTARLTQRLNYQTVTASAFVFYSPTDEDAYGRLALDWSLNDDLSFTVGANLFTGRDGRSLFGMNEENDNAYVRVKHAL